MKNIILVFVVIDLCLCLSCARFTNTDAVNQNISGTIALSLNSTKIYPSAFSLRWNPAASENFLAYKVYYDTVPDISQKSKLAATRFLINDTTFFFDFARSGTTYYLKIFVFDGFSSAESNEMRITTPVCTCGTFLGEKKDGMVLIPAGCFIDSAGFTVTISHDFYMDTAEITGAQWYHVMGPDTSLSQFPIIEVSWYQVILFCNKKSKMEGKDTCYTYSEIIFLQNPPFTIEYIKNLTCDFSKNGFRLPSEDEWEYAYRSGIKTDYFWGKNYYNKKNPLIIEYPVTDSDSLEINTYAWWWHDNETNRIKEGALLKPNAWCLYDIAGNIEEMVWNTFSNRPAFNRFDYIGPDATKESFRITRGGCYYSFAEYLTAFSRSKTPPSISSHLEIGFRTVCTGTARY